VAAGERADALLSDDAQVAMVATGETLNGRDEVIRFQRAYPEPWGRITLLTVIGDDRAAAVEFDVRGEAGLFRCAALWQAADGRLVEGTEYWVTPGGETPPQTRESWAQDL
jgi:ketosteroid isomerase-like protein